MLQSGSYYRYKDGVLAVCPKAGSTSIRQLNLPEIQPVEVYAKQLPCLWFIRHPIKRLISCYRYTKTPRTAETPKKRLTEFPAYEDFIDHVLEGNMNRHWAPQIPMVTNPVFLPTEVHRFEDMSKYIDMPHANKSKTITVNSAYRRDELDNLYLEDIEVWNSV